MLAPNTTVAAEEVIRMFGDDAPIIAAKRAAMFMEEGNQEETLSWILVGLQIREILVRHSSDTLN